MSKQPHTPASSIQANSTEANSAQASIGACKRVTGGVRPGGRSERIVRVVLDAAAAELARSGYVALRIEDVAARACVNKTTIYRRWPTKADLIGATLTSKHEALDLPDTGSLRADLLELLRRVVTLASAPEGQGIARVLMTELNHPEVEALARTLREQRHRDWLHVIGRAVRRGEIPPRRDHRLMVEMINSTVFSRLFKFRDEVDERFLCGVIDLVLNGAKSATAFKSRR